MTKVITPILYEKECECCGCGACMNICPAHAISFVENNVGFLFPHIDDKKCTGCGLCKTVCAFQNIEEENRPLSTYVASNQNREVSKFSASGGVFAAIASAVLKEKGMVFGAVLDEKINPVHVCIDNINDLKPMQGSKYVQSYIGWSYSEVKKLLNEGKQVLFSGTPCQVAGLKGYLKKDYDNLLTVDIVCHGVPNSKFFKEYIASLENKLDGKVVEFKFRDKSIGWGKNGRAFFEKNGRIYSKKIYASESPYYACFLGDISFRESCYICKYASNKRPADISLGDFWGIEKEHPELLKNRTFSEHNGISVVIANTEKGKMFLKKCKELKLVETEFSKASNGNPQLREATIMPKKYKELMKLYSEKGYSGIELYISKRPFYKKYESRIKSLVPVSVKRFVKMKLTK